MPRSGKPMRVVLRPVVTSGGSRATVCLVGRRNASTILVVVTAILLSAPVGCVRRSADVYSGMPSRAVVEETAPATAQPERPRRATAVSTAPAEQGAEPSLP